MVVRPGLLPTLQAGSRYAVWAACGFLLLAVVAVFGQTVCHGFIDLDDNQYVYENAHIRGGLTTQGIAWVFTHSHSGNWHPLTSLSHMLDCQIYNLEAGGHHATNVLLHATTAVLLLLVWWRMTAAFWPSVLVAAVFAVHPLRVESVAWVAERKDVLSGLCFVLTLAAYHSYARHPFSLARYLLVALVFLLGLMAKSMLVTLPFVLLLLDYWPLGRLIHYRPRPAVAMPAPPHSRFAIAWPVLIEKLPLLAIAAGWCAVTWLAQQDSIAGTQSLPFSWRIGHAVESYVAYLGKFFWPTKLGVLYPFSSVPPSIVQVTFCLVVLVGISVVALLLRRSRPYLLVGWSWYLGMLVPVIGLAQIGRQAMADRYTYLPQIGLAVILAWSAAELARRWPWGRWVTATVTALAVAALAVSCWKQTSYWRDTETLWNHTLEVTPANAVAHFGLGTLRAREGKIEDAIAYYQAALAINPEYAEAHSNLGFCLFNQGKIREAAAEYREAVRIRPGYAVAHSSLGTALAAQQQTAEAIEQYQEAVRINPEYLDAQNNLSLTYAEVGRSAEAAEAAERALSLALLEGKARLADDLRTRINFYRSRAAVHPRTVVHPAL